MTDKPMNETVYLTLNFALDGAKEEHSYAVRAVQEAETRLASRLMELAKAEKRVAELEAALPPQAHWVRHEPEPGRVSFERVQ